MADYTVDNGKRVFMLKAFERWAKHLHSHAELCMAARQVLAGQFEADLGGGLCKKRLATRGRGKGGATRVLIAVRKESVVFFLAGRRKSDPGKDFWDKQVAVARILAKGLLGASGQKLSDLLADGSIKEICREPEADCEAQG